MADIQFAVNVWGIESLSEFERFVRRADELGYDVLAVPDHLGWLSPFAALAAAGAISDRLRLRTYVLNYAFWNPTLLAREVATLDVLSHGRAELGIGTGYVKAEFEQAGVPWRPFRERVAGMTAMLHEVRALLADPDHRPRPVQGTVPVMIGGMSDAVLSVAAQHADIVGFTALHQRKGAEPGTLTVSPSTDVADRVAKFRAEAGERPYRSDILLQGVVLDKDPRQAAEAIAAHAPGGLTADALLDTPAVLFAESAAHAAAELRRRHDVYGFDSVTVHGDRMEELGQVIAAYRPSSCGCLPA